MSDNRVTVGVMAMLAKPIGNHNTEEWHDFNDTMDEKGRNLRLNYDGNIVVYIESDGPDYEAGLLILDNEGLIADFYAEVETEGIQVLLGTPKVFVDHWYDGVDPPHINLSLEDAGYEKEGEDD